MMISLRRAAYASQPRGVQIPEAIRAADRWGPHSQSFFSPGAKNFWPNAESLNRHESPERIQRAGRRDHIHNQIAERMGANGWAILQGLSPDQLAQIERMQRAGTLSGAAIVAFREAHWLERQEHKAVAR